MPPPPLTYFCGEVVTAHAVALTSLHCNCCVFKCACLTPSSGNLHVSICIFTSICGW